MPAAMLDGFARRLTVGSCDTGAGVTSTVTLACACPPGPEQLNVNVLAAVSTPVLSLPVSVMLPDQLPDAVQAAVWVEDHVRVALVPVTIELAEELNDIVGAGLTVAGVPTSVDAPPPHALNSGRHRIAASPARRKRVRGARSRPRSARDAGGPPCVHRSGVATLLIAPSALLLLDSAQ